MEGSPVSGRGAAMVPTLREIDFSKIPSSYEGFWVVIRLLEDGQEILAQGESAREAMRLSHANPEDPSIILTQVPEVPTAARMATEDR